jgi:type IV pilus assembly protein PilM
MLETLKSLLSDPPPAMAFEITEAGIATARITSRAEVSFRAVRPGAITVSPLKENINDEGEFASAVREAVASQVGRKRRDIALILPDFCTRIAVLDFDGFPTDPKEQAPLIRFRLKRSVPFDVESAALSYFVQATAHKTVDVVVAVAPLEIVSRYEAPFRAAGMNPGLVTTSALAALELAPDTGLSVMAKLTGRVLTVLVRQGAVLKLVRCLELSEPSVPDIAAVLNPTFVYVEDNLGGRAEKLVLCGLGGQTDEAQRRFEEELGVPVERLNSSLGVPGENNAGLLGYLRSIARNN